MTGPLGRDLMVWSFLWRLAVYGAVLSVLSTFLAGFVMGLLGSSAEDVRSVGQVVQGVALILGALAAHVGAREA